MKDHMLSKALNELRTKGIYGEAAFPKPYKWLWRLGITMPPPLFCPVPKLLLINSLFFSSGFFILYNIKMAIKNEPVDLLPMFYKSILGGIVFSVIITGYYRWRSKSLGLPSWDSFKK